jgi:hypothetical protein
MWPLRDPVTEVTVLDQPRRAELSTAFDVNLGCVDSDWKARVVLGSYTEWLG